MCGRLPHSAGLAVIQLDDLARLTAPQGALRCDRSAYWTRRVKACMAFPPSPTKLRLAMAERCVCSRPATEVHA